MEIDITEAVRLGQEAIYVTILLSAPLLLVGLLVGLAISILQAATQVQEQTLSFIPKIFAVAVVIFLGLPWLLSVLVEYTQTLFVEMNQYW